MAVSRSRSLYPPAASADFVAGMTDSYAVDMYRKLKGFALPS
jgi:dGTP triphosphohydrolase